MQKVFVGMSGGVDSSVSAALLKEQGFAVTGVFIKTWHPDFLACTWREDRHDAMRVAAKLGIPFETLDLSEEYKRDVVDYLVAEYRVGRTPNPDVMCNAHIKFGAFLSFARAAGADAVATGHYARVDNTLGVPRLRAGVDLNKDQSYFLWALSEEALARTLFPVGDLTKPAVRALAKKFDLPVAEKKDSQGVCFLGKVEMESFLKRFIDTQPGVVLDEGGDVIGTHEGAILYTLGQRHGFSVTKKSPSDGPRYVVAKDIEKNTITVSTHRAGEHGERAVSGVVLIDAHTPSGGPLPGGTFQCRFRYRQPYLPCVVEQGGSTRVLFSSPQTAVAPGQFLVVYDGDVVVGGGTIDTTF